MLVADEVRVRKVQDRIQQTVASMLGRRLKDPRLEMVTITDVRVTGDLQHATIFYTVYGSDEQRTGAGRAFESAKGMIRSEVGKALGIRLTPTVEFMLDALPETAASLEDALVAARLKDEQIAKLAEGAEYAGEEDPYRHPDEEDEEAGDEDAWDESRWDAEDDEDEDEDWADDEE